MKTFKKVVLSFLLLVGFSGVVQAKEPTHEVSSNEISLSYDAFVYDSFLESEYTEFEAFKTQFYADRELATLNLIKQLKKDRVQQRILQPIDFTKAVYSSARIYVNTNVCITKLVQFGESCVTLQQLTNVEYVTFNGVKYFNRVLQDYTNIRPIDYSSNYAELLSDNTVARILSPACVEFDTTATLRQEYTRGSYGFDLSDLLPGVSFSSAGNTDYFLYPFDLIGRYLISVPEGYNCTSL